MKTVSIIINGVNCRTGQATKKPSTVTMAVEKKIARQIVELYEFMEEGVTPTEGLISLELVAHYAEDVVEEVEIDDRPYIEVAGEKFIIDEDMTAEKIEEIVLKSQQALDGVLEGVLNDDEIVINDENQDSEVTE